MFDMKVCEAVKHYVYALRDPRPGRGIFSVGRGVGNRCLADVEEAKKNKRKKIAEKINNIVSKKDIMVLTSNQPAIPTNFFFFIVSYNGNSF